MHQRNDSNEESKKTDSVRARMAPDLKYDAELILKRLGITTAQAINMLFARIVEEKGWPCMLNIPNETTKKALNESSQGVGLTKAKNTKALFKALKNVDSEEDDET